MLHHGRGPRLSFTIGISGVERKCPPPASRVRPAVTSACEISSNANATVFLVTSTSLRARISNAIFLTFADMQIVHAALSCYWNIIADFILTGAVRPGWRNSTELLLGRDQPPEQHTRQQSQDGTKVERRGRTEPVPAKCALP